MKIIPIPFAVFVASMSAAALAAAEPTPPASAPPGANAFAHRAISPFIGHTKVADMDGDGHNDIAFHMHLDAGNIKQPGRMTGLAYLRWPDFTQVPVFTGEVTGDRFAAVDVNGDGRIDFVSGKILADGKRAVFWYENPGQAAAGAPPPVWPEHLIGNLVDLYRGQIKDLSCADIDRDGRLDVAVRGQTSTYLFFQKPDGWKLKQLTHGPREGLALVDLDLDGDLDVVLNGLWFETPADPLGNDYVRHEIDPKWFNQNTGNWPDNAAYVGSFDVNRDGLPDIIFSHSEKVGYPISWYSVNSLAEVKTGPWKEHQIAETFDWCETVDIGDVDNDGTLDVLAAKFQRHDPPGARDANVPPFPVSVFYNVAGDGSKWRREDLALDGVYAAALGDVGSDGDLDIVGPTSYWKGPVRLWENKTADNRRPLTKWAYIEGDNNRAQYGTFLTPPKGLSYFGLATTDFDRDGFKDIVSGRYAYRNPGGDMADKWERVDFGLNVDACLALDVDGDAFADVIGEALPNIYWLEAQDKRGTTWKATKVATAPAVSHANGQGYVVAQFVPGGKPEFALTVGDGIRVFTIPAHPDSGEWPSFLVAPGASEQGLAAGDIDGDGLIDIVGGSNGPDGTQKNPRAVSWWKNPGSLSKPWIAHEVGLVVDPKTSADRVGIGDLNGDGRADIIMTSEWWRTPEPCTHLVWFEQPDPRKSSEWTRHVVLNACSLNNLDIADLDHDGDLDLVTCEHKGPNKRLFVLENDGHGNFTEHVVDTGKESHLGTRLADLDGDGDLDMVSIAWDAFKFLHIWRNDAVRRVAK